MEYWACAARALDTALSALVSWAWAAVTCVAAWLAFFTLRRHQQQPHGDEHYERRGDGCDGAVATPHREAPVVAAAVAVEGALAGELPVLAGVGSAWKLTVTAELGRVGRAAAGRRGGRAGRCAHRRARKRDFADAVDQAQALERRARPCAGWSRSPTA